MRHVALLFVLVGAGCDQPVQEVSGTFSTSVAVKGDLLVDEGALRLTVNDSPTSAPTIFWRGNRGGWLTGMDVANNGGSKDFVLASKIDWPNPKDIDDVIYLAHNGDQAPTVGIGVTPPANGHRLEVSAQDEEPEMGTLMLRRSTQQTGNLLTAMDSGGTPRWFLDAGFWMQGAQTATDASIGIKAQASNGRSLVVGKSDGTNVFGFQYAPDNSGSLFLRYVTGGVNNIVLTTNGRPEFPNGLTTSSLRVDAVAPASSHAPCNRGEIASDDDYVYVCTSTNTWRRSALQDF